jgi:hypothetical protein
VSATTGTWDASNLDFSYQWFDDGVEIGGATSSSFLIPESLVAHDLSVEVTGELPFVAPTVAATSSAVTVKPSSTTALNIADQTISPTEQASVTITVVTAPVGYEIGYIVLKYGSKSRLIQLAVDDAGTVTALLPRLPKGSYSVSARFHGSNAANSTSLTKVLKVQ